MYAKNILCLFRAEDIYLRSVLICLLRPNKCMFVET